MKKFMKAIAFATVMCMLLSVAAFAAATDIVGGKVTVTVTDANAAGEQIAFIATKATVASAAAITSGDILDIQQVELTGGTATVELGTKGEESVKIFYGYKSAGVESAQYFEAGVAAPEDTVEVVVKEILTDEMINNYKKDDPSFVLPTTDTDKAGAIIATVDVDANGKTVADMIWSIRHNGVGGVSYVKADTSLFTVLDGAVQIGLAFANGNDIDKAELEISGLHAIVKLSDNSVIFSDEEFDAPKEDSQVEQN